MRGEERGKYGGRLETATEASANERKAKVEAGGGRYHHFEPPRVRREGFDRFAIHIEPDGTARLILYEIKRSKSPTMREFTAIRENLNKNLQTVETFLRDLRAQAMQGKAPQGVTVLDIDKALGALKARRVGVQIVVGPESGLGPPTPGSLLQRLAASVRSRLGAGANVRLEDEMRLDWKDLHQAEMDEHLGRVGDRRQRLAALSERNGVAPPEAQRQSRVLLDAENRKRLPGPVHRSDTPGAIYYDGEGTPVHVQTVEGGDRFDADAAAADILTALRRRGPSESQPGTLVQRRVLVDIGQLTSQQAHTLHSALVRLAAASDASDLLAHHIISEVPL